MSTASSGTPSEPPQRTSHHPGTLAILTATAIGGVLASRLGRTPLILAAGAAALAFLKQKKSAPPPALMQDLPSPPIPVENPAQSQVEQWLSQQISREEQAPVIEFSTVSAPPLEPEDDYHPQSFLLEDAEEAPPCSPSDDSFAQLADPVEWHLPAFAPKIEEAETQAQQAPTPPLPSPSPEDAAWTLGVEPLPSLCEASPFSAMASSMFSAAPVQQPELIPQPAISVPVFEGAAFPDEINVVPAIEPVVHLTPPPPEEPVPRWDPPEPEVINVINEPAPPSAVEPVVETPLEIDVHLAAPGEASFDPPLAAAPHNPWEAEPEAPPTPYVAPFHSHSVNPLVDAEIILRPRAPTQNTVTTKAKPSPLVPIKKDFAEIFDTPPVAGASDALAPTQQQSPREPRARPTWRSWWRGD